MSDFRSIVTAAGDWIVRVARKAAELAKRFIVWISPPPRLCASAILVVFLVSLLSWAIGDRNWDTAFFFPDRESGALVGELHSLPRAWSLEARADLVASEYVLGPVDFQARRSGFNSATRVEGVIFRSGVLYVALSQDAAFYEDAAGAAYLKSGLAGLEKTLHAALPRARRVVVTIGGTEAWPKGLAGAPEGAEKAAAAAPEAPKKSKKN